MSAVRHRPASSEKQTKDVLAKLLGSLELEVMEYMWRANSATVQEAADAIGLRRPIAYTTVMTIMVHLVEKGLLARAKHGKRYSYEVLLTKQQFLENSARHRLHDLIGDFGDIAVAQFVEEVQSTDTHKLDRLRSLIGEQ